MYMTVTVRNQDNAAVPNAEVTLRLTTPYGYVRQGTAATNAAGTVTFTYTTTPVEGRGYYTIYTVATKGTVSGSATKVVMVY